MARIIILLFAVSLIISVNNAFEIQPRIVNGSPAEPTQFPYYAFLQVKMENKRVKSCGATLISDEWLVTAAHCLTKAKKLTVRLGSTHLKQLTFGHKVLVVDNNNIQLHPRYFTLVAWNDIGIDYSGIKKSK